MASTRLNESLTATSGVYFEAGECVLSQQSAHQLIEVFDTPDLGKLMRLDGANMVSERDEFFYHEALVHPVAMTHPNPRTALIIGGGDGGTAEELLKHPSIVRCELCELDGAVIDVAKAHFVSVHKQVFDDARLQVVIGDGLLHVKETTDRFDLIYLDLTDPIGPAEVLYQQSFYRDCQRLLNEGGALTLHIGSPFSHPERAKQTISNLQAVFQTVRPYFVHVPMYGATWGFAVASNTLDIKTIDVATIEARLVTRAIEDRQFYNADMHHAVQCLPEYVQSLLASV